MVKELMHDILQCGTMTKFLCTGSQTVCGNHRGISLVQVTSKAFASVVLRSQQAVGGGILIENASECDRAVLLVIHSCTTMRRTGQCAITTQSWMHSHCVGQLTS